MNLPVVRFDYWMWAMKPVIAGFTIHLAEKDLEEYERLRRKRMRKGKI